MCVCIFNQLFSVNVLFNKINLFIFMTFTMLEIFLLSHLL